jgi:hypothetical protein
MNRMRSIATITYTIGWISTILGVIYRVWLYNGTGAHVAMATHVWPYNLLQLSLLAFVIAIASDSRYSSHSD